MRGQPISAQLKSLDLLIIAARYQQGAAGRLTLTRGYRRRGAVWSDWRLFTREELLRAAEQRLRIAVARQASTPGDFEVLAQVHLGGAGDEAVFTLEKGVGKVDDLNVPTF